ncbi:LPS export ABC transporter periplasmic protein LptC [Caenimonas terrae]|uniref:LPS export ABC transporter periplasmic protein LptC n=1 Tax=Caenimonas terrae TaxID=696074 RepID=A0ABW0N9G0_9BURK
MLPAPAPAARTGQALARDAWDQLSIYLPIILMGLMALGTYWLARNTPMFSLPEPVRPARHEPDYYMRGFSVKTFDATGRLKSEVFGTEARHFPDTDTLEIDKPRIRAYNEHDELTEATATRALSNADGSEVQLIGDAVVKRQPTKGPDGRATPPLEFRGDFLDAFVTTERVKSHKPVTLIRGTDKFTADSLDFDNVSRVVLLQGRVRGTLTPARKP